MAQAEKVAGPPEGAVEDSATMGPRFAGAHATGAILRGLQAELGGERQSLLHFAMESFVRRLAGAEVDWRKAPALAGRYLALGRPIAGRAWIEPDGIYWRPSEPGAPGAVEAITLPVVEYRADGVESRPSATAVEVFALDPEHGNRFWLSSGAVECLGEGNVTAALQRAYEAGQARLALYRRPLDWLKADGLAGGGACLLKHDGAFGRAVLLAPGLELICDSLEYGELVEAWQRKAISRIAVRAGD